ncbi:MAG: SIMPL domain-containing protein [Methylocystis sp.]|nr:MAG: SIMPL domain-containing protein [Methylocystis sp.]
MIRLLFALSVMFGGAACAESLKDTVSNVSVVGEAVEDVAPDRATLRFSVVTERPTAQSAAADNARTVEAILAELKAQGLSDADIQTQGVTLSPYTVEERDAKGKAKTQQSYRASNSLSAVVKPVERAGELTGKIIEKGANSLEGVDYDHSNLAEKRDALRAKAVKDAEHRARIYAEAAGLRLGRVIEIRPMEAAEPIMGMEARVAAAPPSTSVPLRPGLQRVAERVSATWALSR